MRSACLQRLLPQAFLRRIRAKAGASRSAIVVLALCWLAVALPTRAATHYISNGGSDSNNGTSESTPWAHFPGMPTCTSNCLSYSPVAGDVFIPRGCDVWLQSNFPISWAWAGSSGNPIVWDRDVTWFNSSTCSAWNRGIFDACASACASFPTGASQIGGTGCHASGNEFIHWNASWVTQKWIEYRHLYWTTDAGGGCFGGVEWMETNSADDITVTNAYFHDWGSAAYSAGSVTDTDQLFLVNGTPYCAHCLVTQTVYDNCDGTSGSGTYRGGSIQWPNVTSTIMACVANAIKPYYGGEFGNNLITSIGLSFDPTIHVNCIETVDAQGTGIYYFHDNLIINESSNCEGLQIGNSGEIDYVWNNIWDDTPNGPQLPQSSPSKSLFFWNNTVYGWTGCLQQAGHGGSFTGDFRINDNFCPNNVGTSAVYTGNGSFTVSGTNSQTNNVVPTISAATAGGYTLSQTPYILAPTSGSSMTVGVGTNLTSLWPAGFSTNDTSYACSEQTVSTVVQSVCPARTSNTRPTSGAWDDGVYEFSGAPPPSIATMPPAVM